MKKVSIKNIKYIPASHENQDKPGVWKKILFRHKDFSPYLRIQMINWAKLPKGKEFISHYHEDMDEVFIIISGRAEIKIGEEIDTLASGDAVLIPKGIIHQMKNIGDEDTHYIVIGASEGKGGKTIIL